MPNKKAKARKIARETQDHNLDVGGRTKGQIKRAKAKQERRKAKLGK